MADPTVGEVLRKPPIRVPKYGSPQYDQLRAEAAIQALHKVGRYEALLQGAKNVGIRGRQVYPIGSQFAMGAYDPRIDTLTMARDADQIRLLHHKFGPVSDADMRNVVAVHELTHGLQEPERRDPTSYDRQWAGEIYGTHLDNLIANKEHPENRGMIGVEDSRAFQKAIEAQRAAIGYSHGEAGARFASELGYGEQNLLTPEVADIYRKFPGLSMVFAQRNMQPDRPVQVHRKAEPEWTDADRAYYKKNGVPPPITMEDMVKWQGDNIRARWAREEGTAPPPAAPSMIDQATGAFSQFNNYMNTTLHPLRQKIAGTLGLDYYKGP